MLTTVWVAASTKRWLRACRASASRFCITSAVTPHASAAIANRPAASESQPTRTRCAGRRGGGLTGLRAGLAAFAGFDSVRAAALTVAAPWAGRLDSPSAGPAGRTPYDERAASSTAVRRLHRYLRPLQLPRIAHEIHPILGAGCARHPGREDTSAAGRVREGSAELVIDGVGRTAGLRLGARRRPGRRPGAFRWWRRRNGRRVWHLGWLRRVPGRHP